MRPLRRDGTVTTGTEPTPAPVVGWRSKQLQQAGFDPPLADAVARDGAFDLHALLELTDRGCPPEIAVRIVAPLGEEAQP